MFVGLERHPEGLLVRLTPDSTYRVFPPPEFRLPSSLRGRAPGSDEMLLLGEYRRMLDGRTQYLERHQRPAEADTIRRLLQGLPR
jgi:hypothetical protein